jgi:hypothetical protein
MKMRIPRVITVSLVIPWVLPGCVVYHTYERNVRVWNSESGELARNKNFSYGHATPALYFPRTPAPVSVTLDERGEAKVRIPGAFGWVRSGDFGALIQGSAIRDGGTFALSRLSASDSGSRVSPWKVSIEKPSD